MQNKLADECAYEIRRSLTDFFKQMKQKNINIHSIDINMVEVTTMGQHGIEFIPGSVMIKIGTLDKNGYYWTAWGKT